jgi:hypothetical protein
MNHFKVPAMLAGLAIVLSSCSADSRDAVITDRELMAASGIDFSVEFDEETGRIDLPYDRFVPSGLDEQVLHNAAEVAATLCWREMGLPATGTGLRPSEIYLSEHLYGPWTMSQAQKFGFVVPAPDADLRANNFIPEGTGEPSVYDSGSWARIAESNSRIPADKAAEAKEKCSPDHERWFIGHDGPWKAAMAQVSAQVDSSAELGAIVDDLGECFEARGLEPDPEYPYQPKGSDAGWIDEEQIELAISTVECKQEVEFTKRVADLYVTFQAPVMLEYEDELIAHQLELRNLLIEAEEIVSAHPETFEIPQ